ncbi:MAG: hypothetical protein H7338_17900 [Candidatus Sericytochromatia bacterium]|nr:hypothetical protein [Candidatus Sericytochromatia bacterium]
MDRPQLEYFQAVAADHLQAGDRVILCTPEPSWVHPYIKKTSDYRILDCLEHEIIGRQGAKLSLTLTGDLHHYSRYVAPDGTRSKITAGGGGAFLHETHNLPQDIHIFDLQVLRLPLTPPSSHDLTAVSQAILFAGVLVL